MESKDLRFLLGHTICPETPREFLVMRPVKGVVHQGFQVWPSERKAMRASLASPPWTVVTDVWTD